MAGAKRESAMTLGMNREAWAILSLLAAPGIGPAAVHRALAAAAAARITMAELIDMPPRKLIDLLPPGLHDVASLTAGCSAWRRASARAMLDCVAARGGDVLAMTEPEWPGALSSLRNAGPPLLFTWGNRALLNKAAGAVVGARTPCTTGAWLARECAAFIAGEGGVVVSGGARGIDSCAHAAAIAAGGETMVILPQGLLTYTPPPSLARAVADGRALIVSQFGPDAPWETHAAVTRNATISALARLVCVVEPRKSGGSIRAARLAIGQRKPVAAWCSTPSMRRLLETAGAVELADAEGALRREYVRELWCQSVEMLPVQSDLL